MFSLVFNSPSTWRFTSTSGKVVIGRYSSSWDMSRFSKSLSSSSISQSSLSESDSIFLFYTISAYCSIHPSISRSTGCNFHRLPSSNVCFSDLLYLRFSLPSLFFFLKYNWVRHELPVHYFSSFGDFSVFGFAYCGL